MPDNAKQNRTTIPGFQMTDMHPSADRRRIIVITLLMNAMAMLGYTVFSLASPYIGRSFGVSALETLWPPDAYLTALICVMLFNGYLTERFGARKLLQWSIAGMALCAVACVVVCYFLENMLLLTGIAFLMGAFAAPATPATQSLIVSRFPPEQRSTAMGIWGAGTMIGVLSASIACALLIDSDFRPFVFTAVIPFGLAVVPFIQKNIPKAVSGHTFRTDWTGLVLLSTTILALGTVLNTGDNYNWFSSPFIVVLTSVFASALIGFILHYRRTASPIVNFSVLRDRNFAIAAGITFGVAVFSTGQFETELLGGVLEEPSGLISLRSALGGVALLLGTLLGGSSRLAGIKPSTTVTAAILIALVGKLGFTWYGPTLGSFGVVWPQVVSGFGLGLIIPPLAIVAYRTMSQSLTDEAAGFYSMAGQLGGALGIAMLGIVVDSYSVRTVAQDVAATVSEPGVIRSFIDVFWIELVGTAIFLPAALMAGRGGRAEDVVNS